MVQKSYELDAYSKLILKSYSKDSLFKECENRSTHITVKPLISGHDL